MSGLDRRVEIEDQVYILNFNDSDTNLAAKYGEHELLVTLEGVGFEDERHAGGITLECSKVH